MLLDALVLCLVVALLAKGRLHRLSSLTLRHAWLFVLGFAVQALILIPALAGAAGWIHIVSYAPLFAGVALNLSIRELWVAGLGLALNFSVIAANGGKMPTSPAAVQRIGRPELARHLAAGRDARNVLAGKESRLVFLSDQIPLPAPYPYTRRTVFSVGDVLLTVGICALLLRGTGAFGLGRSQPT